MFKNPLQRTLGHTLCQRAGGFFMARIGSENETLTAAECADKTGLTVKALRVYERQGLLKPMRTQKQWRIYNSADLARLGEITALQALGLKLSEIATLLRGSSSDINRMLELQQDEMLQRRARIESGLGTISALRQRATAGETLSISDIASSIKETQMTSSTSQSIAWKRYEQMRPRVAIEPTAQDLKDAVGYYKLEDGPTFHIFVEGGKLMTQIPNQPSVEFFKEAPDSWFSSAVLAQITFKRDLAGKVTALTLHQHGLEIGAPRISEEDAKAWNEEFLARIARSEPHPDSRRLATMLVEHHIKGEACDEILEPALAQVVAEQREGTKQLVAEFGALKNMTFLAVTRDGWDAFRATFENGEMDMSVYIAANGKISGAWIEPPKAESFWKKLKKKIA
jgi:DNA-binding transcriptional MerR regulator